MELLIFPLVLAFVLFVFCGWDWLSQGSELSTGTLQGVQVIAQTPSMWGDVLIGIGILFAACGAYCLFSLLVLPYLWRGGKDK